ncbi:uncharacterized protein LOC109544429 [Dendroctonus ponderosae]|uniref:Uncharacterized protein n=1 Tax=Dendroctonus ponderosae TaxID=77166 RepID=U4U7U5_DENPD|nr:uncharacterized protein LOC109544429 [Dendroctonus ponderosae]ERL89974.1 hypothetical protein D910_07333 [Dendroctonus ponderosae]
MQDTSALVVLIVFLVDQSTAQSCRTCRGTLCSTEKELNLECSQFLPALPFESQLLFSAVDENAEYGCLDVEFYVDESITSIQQCIISNDLKSYCSMVEEVMKVKSCSVSQPDLVRIEREINDEPTDKDDTETDTDDPVYEDTTVLPSSGVVHLVTIFSFIVLIPILL